ncbi:MAG: hypothetical protein ABIH34_03420 [Nanoarchaeota archaeon]
MSMQLPQITMAVASDFDMTLSAEYCQRPLFEAYDVDEARFWADKKEHVARLDAMLRDEDSFPEALRCSPEFGQVMVDSDTYYLQDILDLVLQGPMKGLSRQRLRELGQEIRLYEGVPEFIEELKTYVRSNPEWTRWNISIEFYIISTGIGDLIRGSAVGKQVDGIYACEFLPDIDANPATGEISQIVTPVNFTNKTRYIYEILKGSSHHVNDKVAHRRRRIRGDALIYLGDGPTDIAPMAVVNKLGGKSIAVYDPTSQKNFDNAATLNEEGRVAAFCPADYRRGSHLRNILERYIRQNADRIVSEKEGITWPDKSFQGG